MAQVPAMAKVWSLAQELSHAAGVAKKKKKKGIYLLSDTQKCSCGIYPFVHSLILQESVIK